MKKTFDFIEKKNGVSRTVRKLWTPNERKLWTLRLKKCPICQEKWTKDNPITKEHIHPLVLGGDESTVNIIPLCYKCNTSRNHVMYVSLGTEKIKQLRKRMPIIKKPVENFIIWAHASIYLDQEALLEYQDLTEAFEKNRGIENLFNDTNNQTPKNEDRSIWTKIKKSLPTFSTNSSNKIEVNNTIQSVEVKKDKPEKIIIGKKTEHTRAFLKIPNLLEQKESHDNNNESVDKAKFIHIIDKLIADDEEISVTAIGQRIRRMQQHNNEAHARRHPLYNWTNVLQHGMLPVLAVHDFLSAAGQNGEIGNQAPDGLGLAQHLLDTSNISFLLRWAHIAKSRLPAGQGR